jgi:diguanylate cyclase
MAGSSVITLDIGRRSRGSDQETLASLLDATTAVLRDLLLADDDPERAQLAERLETCRSTLASGVPVRDIADLFAAGLADGQLLASKAGAQRAERARDSMVLVNALREAITTIGSEMSSMHTSITQSTERFEAIGHLTSPLQIKARLLAEVLTLKQIASKRRKAWEDTAKSLTNRVATLERDLSAAQGEVTTDPLTGIANRRGFDQALTRWLATSPSSFAMAILDIDEFKRVNDEHGHAGGDAVLKWVATTLQAAVRDGDIVARIGGDEFGILAGGLSLRQAQQRFVAILSRIAKSSADAGVGGLEAVSLSCGIAEHSAGDTAGSLFERADQAQYDAKRQGKNRVVAKERPLLRDLTDRQSHGRS